MIRWRSIAAVLVLSAAIATAQDVRLRVALDVGTCLRVRSEPRADAARVGCLAPGTSVTALAAVPYWRQIEAAGVSGWVAKRFLVQDSVAAPVAIASARDDMWLAVHFVDVGQGDGIWISTPDDGIPGNGIYEGKNIVIDGGPDASDARNRMLQYLLDAGHPDALVDALVVTHPHDDHYPGALGILRHFDVATIYEPGYPKRTASWLSFLARAAAESALGRPTKLMSGRSEFATPAWGRELEAAFLWSYPGTPAGLGSRQNTIENNASIVLRLRYGEHTFLFMGDAEGKERDDPPDRVRYVEMRLLESLGDTGLAATVLKVAHHGSETSSTLPFIAAVNPRIVVIQSGRRAFGGRFLPDGSVLARYCAHNPRLLILRTDQDDDLLGRSAATDQDGDDIVIMTNGRELHVNVKVDGRPAEPRGCPP
ncbi:MAG TPA: MBL fold metallo-hydrolase [Gemmatimonadaceae bacterium]|nr:MBL fold metallo-hydrolase [Gemmatimonadaceae bacterium]